jgi:hypothetical protein
MVVMRMIAQNSDQDQRSALQPQVEARPQVSIALKPVLGIRDILVRIGSGSPDPYL